MTQRLGGAVAHAWRMARRDRDLLLAVAGLFVFLPVLALNLLVPAMPPIALREGMSEPEQRMLAEVIANWFVDYGPWYALAGLLVQFGQLTLLVLYLDPERPSLTEALSRAIRRFFVYLVAMVITGVPASIGLWLVILVVPALYVMGRLLMTGPVIVAERPIGPIAAVSRSWVMTRGQGLVLAGMAAIPVLGGLLAAPLLALDRWLRLQGGGNPVAITLVDAGAAGVTTAALLAATLIEIAAYRRLAR